MKQVRGLENIIQRSTIQQYRGLLVPVCHHGAPAVCKRSISTGTNQTLPMQAHERNLSSIHTTEKKPALARLSTIHLLRNIILGSFFTNKILFKISMTALAQVANPKRRFLYPENNPVTRAILRKPLYDHFCAGTTPEEVRTTVAEMKEAGYSGVILIPTREIMDGMGDSKNADAKDLEAYERANISAWKDAHLGTLEMIGKNDYMGMKFTGAGSTIYARLAAGHDPPVELLKAVDEICAQASRQGSRIWFDAEQQVLQPTIDRWVVDLMRKHNKAEPLISNTYQAYLKITPSVLEDHVSKAQNEGWILGVKLVRGAYLLSEVRSLIHDTKADTDKCYDMLIEGLITRTLPGFIDAPESPDVHVFVAGHNTDSINKSVELYKKMVSENTRYSPARWGQLQGMADEVSCELLNQCEEAERLPMVSKSRASVKPEVYKCLQWGSVGESMQFLLRRATENHGAAHRMAGSIRIMKQELYRRMFRF